MSIACAMFVEHHGKELLEENLYRNFILHLCSLFDFELISPQDFYTTVQKIQVRQFVMNIFYCITNVCIFTGNLE